MDELAIKTIEEQSVPMAKKSPEMNSKKKSSHYSTDTEFFNWNEHSMLKSMSEFSQF
jgi:hypothetical protein